MPFLIVFILVVLVALLSTILVQILGYMAAAVTVPSLLAMNLIRAAGLTDPDWYVVLHALLGAAVGATVHLWRSGFAALLAGPFVAPFTASRWVMEQVVPGRRRLHEAVGGFAGLAIVLFVVLPLLFDAVAWTFGFLPGEEPVRLFECHWSTSWWNPLRGVC